MRVLSQKLRSWASIIEPETLQQAHNTASMPFVQPWLALMSDAHLGKGATVGSVIPTKRAVIPAAVGVDIGCGMIAARTQWTADDPRFDRARLHVLRESIEEKVPLSPGNYNKSVEGLAVAEIAALEARPGIDSAERVAPNWRIQAGSLGGGNHFIEVTRDELGRVYAFLHSGSRGVGNKLAQGHIKAARSAHHSKQWGVVRLPDPDLAWLDEGTPEFDDYIRDLRWAQEFAAANRRIMLDRVLDAMGDFMGELPVVKDIVQCHHNYTEQATVFGEEVWLSRKGAIDASNGTAGLIPGSMSSASYIVSGRGNPDSFNSAPHGAGRNFSRKRARSLYTMDDLETEMSLKGIEWSHNSAFIDEIRKAYKPIDVVMEDAADLVRVEHELHQLLNVKGT
jgi:tRNA-splicing ligase RtcB (3'-phosphate/5'-hydroxy nucleic acid ligase)